MVSCKQCGAPTDSAASFCRSCGAALSAANAVSSVPSQPAAATAYAPAPALPKKKSRKALKIIGIVFAVFFGLIILSAIFGAGKKDGTTTSHENSESNPAAAPVTLSDEEKAKEGQQMCTEVQSQINDFLKNSIKGIECQPSTDGDGIGLVVAYPLPILAKENLVRKNTLYLTFSLAGGVASRHSQAPVKTIYAMDSSTAVFAVSGEFAEQTYTKMVNNQLSEDEAKEAFYKAARRVKLPPTAH